MQPGLPRGARLNTKAKLLWPSLGLPSTAILWNVGQTPFPHQLEGQLMREWGRLGLGRKIASQPTPCPTNLFLTCRLGIRTALRASAGVLASVPRTPATGLTSFRGGLPVPLLWIISQHSTESQGGVVYCGPGAFRRPVLRGMKAKTCSESSRPVAPNSWDIPVPRRTPFPLYVAACA